MALLVLLENIVNTLEKGHSAVGLFLDLKKAFDTVDHDLLLQKMNIYGIRGNVLNWFSSYLRNRKQTVIYNNHESDYKEIKCGVPQGQGCQPVRNFRILYGFYMQNTGVRIWPRKYGNWALSVLSLKVLLPEQSLPVLGSKSVRICGILCLRTFKYLFNHQNIQSSLFHMWQPN